MKLAFIHVRKNAGTSIKEFFGRTGVDLKVVDSPSEAMGCVSFAVARNPYTRCVSSWKYCRSTRNRSLIDCLNNPPNVDDLDPTGLVKPGHDYRHFTKKQCDFMFDGDIGPSHILTFETLEDDLRKLCLMYGIPFVKLDKYNVGTYQHTLTDLEYEAIYQFYKEDFDKLGYSK